MYIDIYYTIFFTPVALIRQLTLVKHFGKNGLSFKVPSKSFIEKQAKRNLTQQNIIHNYFPYDRRKIYTLYYIICFQYDI